jgi:hypothetical protein
MKLMAAEFMAKLDEARRVYARVCELGSRLDEWTATTETHVGSLIRNNCAVESGDTSGLSNQFDHLMQVAKGNAKVLSKLADHLKQSLDTIERSDQG